MFANEAGLLHRIQSGMIARVMLVLLLCAEASIANAGSNMAARTSQPAGLMWNRTGLPAVFPLQVKTPPDQDYFLTLIDEETGDDAFAAYIKGGAFFKVLVPPGVFRLKFAAGDVWQGEEDLFGPDENTRVFELRKPLTFETRGLAVKAGHIVNLLERRPSQISEVTLKDQLICQSFRRSFAYKKEWSRDFLHQRWILTRSKRAGVTDRGLFDEQHRPGENYQSFTKLRYDQLRYDLRSRYCG